jgi:hypothetical protein
LGKSAEVRLMIIHLVGNSKPELIKALLTRSLLSLIAVSGKPTIESDGIPGGKDGLQS